MVLAIVVLGGMGSQIGIVIAAVVLVSARRSSSATSKNTAC